MGWTPVFVATQLFCCVVESFFLIPTITVYNINKIYKIKMEIETIKLEHLKIEHNS